MVAPLLEVVDLVLVMTVNPGWGGQAYIGSCLPKIRELRRLKADLNIEVDGGIVPETLRETRAAGANVFVVGSYLVRSPSIAEGMANLRAACG
jgi:ribulose-phosphate 3-epimerase